MLQIIREKLTGWVAGVIFVLIGLAFALWGIDIGGANLNYVAKVNGEEIPVNEFRRQQQSQLAQYAQFYSEGIPAEVEDRLRQGLLDSFVRQALIDQRTRKLGYRIGDTAVAGAIRDMSVFQVGGEFSMDLYQARLSAQGMNPAMFEARMRESLRSGELQQGVASSSFVTDKELARFVALEDQKRELSWLVLPVTAFTGQVEIDDQAVAAEYEANPAAYQSPETVSLQYIRLRRASLGTDFDVSEEELRNYYQQELSVGRFKGAEERRASHILIAVDGDTPDEAASTLAAELMARLEAGEDFAALAREYSDDPVSAEAGGDLDWAEPDAYVPPFREALLAMREGELRGPVRTEFGYHLIRLDGVRGEKDKPFEEVREELRAELQAAAAEDQFYKLAEELRQRSFEAFNELAPVAEDMGLELETVEGVTRDGGPGIGAAPRVRASAFSDPVLLDSENSDLIELPEGDAVVLRVVDHALPALEPLEAVRARIVAGLKRQEAERLALEEGMRLTEKSRLAGALVSEDAPEGIRRNEKREIGRNEPGIARDLLTAVFDAPAPRGAGAQVGGLQLAGGDYVVYALHAVRAGDLAALTDEQREQRRLQLAARLGNQELAAYIEALRRDARVVINEEQLN